MGRERAFTDRGIWLLPHQHKDSKVLLLTSSEFQLNFLLVPPTYGNIWAGKRQHLPRNMFILLCFRKELIHAYRSGNVAAVQSCHGALWVPWWGAMCYLHAGTCPALHLYVVCPCQTSRRTLQRWERCKSTKLWCSTVVSCPEWYPGVGEFLYLQEIFHTQKWQRTVKLCVWCYFSLKTSCCDEFSWCTAQSIEKVCKRIAVVLNSCNRNHGVSSVGGNQESKPVPRHPSYSLRALYNQAAKKTAGDAAPAMADAKEHLSWPSRGPDSWSLALMCPQ